MIRQNLLGENRISKYLLYALGEIVLVVIGIMIALQINNWNEERKVLIAEQEILQNLKAELIANRARLQEFITRHTQEYERGVSLLHLFGSDISGIPESHLDTLLGSIESGYTFEARDGYLQSLIASNKVSYIRNEELVYYISSFESMVVDATQEFDIIMKILVGRLWPAVDGRISCLNRLSTYDNYSDFPLGSYTSDYSWFFQDHEMEDVVGNIVSWKMETISDEKVLDDAIKRMIELIEEEEK